MTAVPPPAAPAAPPAADPGNGGLDVAQQASRDRLENAFPQPLPPGAPADVAAAATAPPGEGESAFDIFADGAEDTLIGDDMPYRDGKRLREQVTQAKEQFRPFRDAFGNLDENQRATLLANAPTLGSDLAAFSAVAPQLHADDRAWFMGVMSKFATDPLGAAEELARGAGVLREQFAAPGSQPPAAPAPPGQQAMPEWAQPEEPVDPAQQPLTRGDLDQWAQQQQYANEVRQSEAAIIAAAGELGYAPNPNDPIADDRFRSFIGMAARPEVNGDLNKAHALMQQRDQAIIDGFVQAKAANADRPGAPVTGAAPADMRVLETLSDGREAMLARLDGTLGPDPRRRGADD